MPTHTVTEGINAAGQRYYRLDALTETSPGVYALTRSTIPTDTAEALLGAPASAIGRAVEMVDGLQRVTNEPLHLDGKL